MFSQVEKAGRKAEEQAKPQKGWFGGWWGSSSQVELDDKKLDISELIIFIKKTVIYKNLIKLFVTASKIKLQFVNMLTADGFLVFLWW